jgi:internalin A
MIVKLTKSIKIFCSYSDKDKILFSKLESQLQLLKRRNQIAELYTSKFVESEYAFEVDPHLNTADILLLFISPDYANLEYQYNEATYAWNRYLAGEARVVPVILRPFDWKWLPFGNLYALPKFGKPVNQWSNPDDAISDIIKGIQIVIKEIVSST